MLFRRCVLRFLRQNMALFWTIPLLALSRSKTRIVFRTEHVARTRGECLALGQSSEDTVVSCATIINEPFDTNDFHMDSARESGILLFLRGRHSLVCIWNQYVCLTNSTKPITPSNISMLDQEGFVRSMISKAREEHSPGQERNLNRFDVDVDSICAPGV